MQINIAELFMNFVSSLIVLLYELLSGGWMGK